MGDNNDESNSLDDKSSIPNWGIAVVTREAATKTYTNTLFSPDTIVEIGWVIFLFSVLTWPTFSWPSDLSSAGNTLRQLCYISLLILLILAVTPKGCYRILKSLPYYVFIPIAWCWISISWSISPDIGARRLGLTTLVFLYVFISVNFLDRERMLRLSFLVLSGSLIANYIVVIAAPQIGIHQFNTEGDPGLVGLWKGFFPEKNIAGAASAVTLLLGWFSMRGSWRLSRIAIIILATYFLIQTGSKTSLAICAGSIICANAFKLYRPVYWPIALIIVTFSLITLATYTVFDFENLIQPLDRPDTLTGRSQIWSALLSYVADNWLLGSGYGSFWNTGDASPIYQYSRTGSWVQKVSSGHDGYLDLAVQLGIPGLLLTIYAFIVRPLSALLARPSDTTVAATPLSLIIFCAGHNVLESTILDRDMLVNVILFFSIALIIRLVRKGTAGGYNERLATGGLAAVQN